MKAMTIARVFMCILLLVGLLAAPSGAAYAQQGNESAPDSDDQPITIIIEDGGRVIVNGEEVSGDARVLRVDPDDGNVVVVNPDRFGFPATTPARFRFDGDWGADLEEGMAGLRYALPHVEPLMDQAVFFARQTAEVMELERESAVLARRVRAAEGAERAQLENELRAKLAETFEAKLQARQERVERLEEQLNEQRNLVEERRSNQDEIIERRMRDLLGEEDALDW